MFSRFLGVFSGRGSRRVPKTGFTALTSKIGPKNFYKGKGVPSVGHHTRKGELKAWSSTFEICQPLDQH